MANTTGRKYGGRKSGTPNKLTQGIRKALLKLLNDNLDTLRDDLKAMKGKERVDTLVSLAKHLTPPAVNPERLTEEQLEQLYDYLKDKQNEQKRA
jgi:hypothetical protein